VSRDQVPSGIIEREREIYRAQVKGKPANVVEKIVEGKLDKFFGTVCLLDQAFIKNPDQSIRDLVSAKISELGENIVIRRFTRYAVGEDVEGETVDTTEQAQAA
jgi:elongation factor Ts